MKLALSETPKTGFLATRTIYVSGVVSLAACLSLPPLFGWGTYAYVPEHSSCFCDWTNSVSYAVFMITCCFGGPFGVMTVCNVFIYRTVRASRHRLRKISMTGSHTVELNVSATGVVSVPRDESSTDAETSTDMCKDVRFADVETMADTCKEVTLRKARSPSTEVILKRRSFFEKQAQKKEHRLAMSLIVVVISFVICWLPYCISMLFTIFLPGDVPKGFHMFTITFGYANSCCNPIIYGAMNLQFRKGFQKLYCCCRNS